MIKLEQAIREYGKEIGFDIIRFTSAESFLRDEKAAIARIRNGLMKGLSWYTEDRVRLANNPKKLLPNAKSVISVAVSYLTEERPQDDDLLRGKIARYAWGDDYHKILKTRLREFANALPSISNKPVNTRIFVDDGPMNDRAAAERSGIGWFGKNTNILSQTHGSWIFLGQIITDLELEINRPLLKNCGECVRCIDACPTGAIVAPYVIDNTKCISFLTIELREAIPVNMRPMIGDWIFGCDICQDICPVNIDVEKSQVPGFHQRHDFAAPDLIPLLDLDDAGFSERFKNSAVKRTKRVGLQRNVCVALGNIGDPRAVPALIRTLSTAPPLVKQHAAWALGRIGNNVAILGLSSALSKEENLEVRAEIEAALREAKGTNIDNINAPGYVQESK